MSSWGQRDAFLALLEGQDAQRVVWTADIDYWVSGSAMSGKGDPRWKTEEGYLALCAQLGIMPYYWYDEFWVAAPEYDHSVSVETAQRGDVTSRVWRTPIGTLEEEVTFMPASCSSAHTRYAVSGRKDLDVLRYLVEHRRLRPTCLEDYPERLALWRRYDGVPCLGLPRSALPALLYEWAGVAQGIFLLMDFPEVVEEVFELMAAQERPILDAVCALAPPLVHFADNVSGDTMTGLYDPYMAGVHRERIARLHKAGTRCAVHLDGVVQGILPKLVNAGFDAIEALTPQPGGDLPVEEMRGLAGNERVVLWGGVPGVVFSPPHTWRDMERHVRRVLEAWEGTRFVLGVADQVPPDGDIGFCRRISDLVAEWGAARGRG